MSKFNTAKEVAATKTTNLAGGKAYRMDARQELVHAVLTTFLDDKYYESGGDRIKRIQKLVSENEPRFVANLAVIARTEFNLRSVSHLLLGELSKTHNGDSLVKDAIVASAVRPDDLLEIAAYVGKPMPKQVKRGIRNAILKYSPYQLAKYKGEGKKISMVDLFNLTHPKAQHATREQVKAWEALMEGNLKQFDTWEDEMSATGSDAERKKVWESLIMEDKLGYMALIRNLNNYIKYGISAKAQARVVARLTDPEEIARSKQLPFRFYTAYQNVGNDRAYKTAVSDAMDLALSNTPTLKGKTLIAVDTSGSMTQGQKAIEKAAIFAACLARANVNADVILYDTSVSELKLNNRTPVVDIAESIIRNARGGGTQTSLVFQYASARGEKYDRIIILSDNESWADGYSWSRGSGVQPAYTDYKKKSGADPFIYAIDIEGYGTKDLTGGKVFHLTGWSDRLLDFIGQAERGENLVDYVENFEVPSTVNPIPSKSVRRRKAVMKKAEKKVAPKKKKRTIKKRSAK